MLTKFDIWLGKRLFVPAIIWFCQRTKQTQYAVANYATWLSILIVLYGVAEHRTWSWVEWVFAPLLTLVFAYQTYRTGRDPDRRTTAFYMRKIIIVLLLIDLVLIGLTLALQENGDGWGYIVRALTRYVPWKVLALIAEYARDIDNIPPRKIKEKRKSTSGVLAPARARA